MTHGGCNDITNDVNTLNNIDRIPRCAKKKPTNTKLIISEIIIRKYMKSTDKKVEVLNKTVKKSCKAHNTTLTRHEK